MSTYPLNHDQATGQYTQTHAHTDKHTNCTLALCLCGKHKNYSFRLNLDISNTHTKCHCRSRIFFFFTWILDNVPATSTHSGNLAHIWVPSTHWGTQHVFRRVEQPWHLLLSLAWGSHPHFPNLMPILWVISVAFSWKMSHDAFYTFSTVYNLHNTAWRENHGPPNHF